MSAEFQMSPVAIPAERLESPEAASSHGGIQETQAAQERSGSPLNMTSPIFGAVGESDEDSMPAFVLPARLSDLSLNADATGSASGRDATRAPAIVPCPLASATDGEFYFIQRLHFRVNPPHNLTRPTTTLFSISATATDASADGFTAAREATSAAAEAGAEAIAAGMLTVAVDLSPTDHHAIGGANSFVATPASSHPATQAEGTSPQAKYSLLHGSPTAKPREAVPQSAPSSGSLFDPLTAAREDAAEKTAGDAAADPSVATSPCRRTSSDASTVLTPGLASTGVVWLTKGWEDADALLVVVPGSGGSMPGVWSRTLCIEQVSS